MQKHKRWQAQTVPQVLFALPPTLSRGVPPIPDDSLPLADLLDMWRRVRDGLDALRALRPDLFAGRAGV